VRRVIDTLTNEQVARFVEDVASNLGNYGLDKPQLQITFSSFASENTPESNAGERPFASIAFGKIEGNDVYARVGDEPFVVAVRKGLLDQLMVDPMQWQDVSIFNFKPEQIHRVTITTDKEISLVRDAKNQWTVAKGTGVVDQPGIQALLNTLSTLHAARWISPTKPEHGFDKPQMTITFTTSPDDKSTQKLVVGANTQEGAFGRVDGREGTFAIGVADLNGLKSQIIQTAPSAPLASPAASVGPAGTPAVSPSPR
jgi:hypothetical protein